LDPRFTDRCLVTNRCAPAAGGGLSGGSRFGAPGPGAPRIFATIFRPQDAVRLNDRPAARR
jgi:hypothetical protein